MRKKLISIILLISFLIAVCICAVSCAQTEDVAEDKTIEKTSENDNKDENTDNSDDELEEDYLPEIDYNGYEFKILVRGEAAGQDVWDSTEIVAEEETGDTINDAVYMRNREIEGKYNIQIKGIWTKYDDMLPNIKKGIAAGDNNYDVVLLPFNHASSATKNGYLYNLKEAPYIDLSQPWWDQSIIAETSVMNKTYYAANDSNIMDKEGTWTMMFNKQMIADFGLDSPYTLVNENKWTFDKFIEMTRDISLDLDGDGTFGQYDRYGFATTTDSVQGLLFASGLRIIKKDASDIPYFALQGDDVMQKLEKISYIMRGSDNITQLMQDYSGVDTHLIIQASFEESRALFFAEVMQGVVRLRQMDTDFGIVPLPKWDENQPNYHTNVHQWASSTMAIPNNVEDIERSGIILESIAYGGSKYIKPAYYDVVLKTKQARDNESSAMLDIIFASRSADIGYIDNVGSLMSDLVQTIQRKRNEFVSVFERRSAVIENDIAKIIEAYENLD